MTMKSIMHDKRDRTCYLCMRLHGDYDTRAWLQEHHVMAGTANRRMSEKYGLKVYLCLQHHLEGPEAVHKNGKIAGMLKQEAQKAFIRKYPNLSFRDIFGISYLPPEAAGMEGGGDESPGAAGIRFFETGMDDMEVQGWK